MPNRPRRHNRKLFTYLYVTTLFTAGAVWAAIRQQGSLPWWVTTTGGILTVALHAGWLDSYLNRTEKNAVSRAGQVTAPDLCRCAWLGIGTPPHERSAFCRNTAPIPLKEPGRRPDSPFAAVVDPCRVCGDAKDDHRDGRCIGDFLHCPCTDHRPVVA
jgi:hypothetical protein